MTTAPSELPPPQPAAADTRADASAGPPLVLVALGPAQELARVICPTCQQRSRFESRPDKGYDAGREWRCRNPHCRRALGLLVVDSAGWTLLRLAAV